VAPGRVLVPGRGTPPVTSSGAVTGDWVSYKPRPLFPEPVLPTETGMVTEPGALTEISEPPEPELVPEPLELPAGAGVPVLLPEPVLSTETGALTEPGAVTETHPEGQNAPALHIRHANSHVAQLSIPGT
jgi:hypothetical protein